MNPLPIHENRTSTKVIAYAAEGYKMSNLWWKQTHKLQENGELWGIYQTKSGKLRRTVIGDR